MVYSKYNIIFLCLLGIYWVYIFSFIVIRIEEIKKAINANKNNEILSNIFKKIRFHVTIVGLLSAIYCAKNNKSDEFLTSIIIGIVLFCIFIWFLRRKIK